MLFEVGLAVSEMKRKSCMSRAKEWLRRQWLGIEKRQRKREYAKIDDQSGFPLSKPLGAKVGLVCGSYILSL